MLSFHKLAQIQIEFYRNNTLNVTSRLISLEYTEKVGFVMGVNMKILLAT